MEHDLEGLLRKKTKFSQSQVKCLLKQMLEGLKYLHER